jgi:dienelactone hydrolase
MQDASLEWSALITRGLAPFLAQAVPHESSAFDRTSSPGGVRRLFSYAARAVPLAPAVEERRADGDLRVERVSYATGPFTRASAVVVAPSSPASPLPAVLVLHCHSGVYRWGKEKVVAAPGDPQALLAFREAKYAGQSLAHGLASRGFAVIAPDAFYFGARALGDGPGDAELDRRRRESESLVAKVLALAGHSWPALIAWEDQRAIDYLCSRPDVDARRVGCLGLSLGGFRAVLLAAKDRRVTAVVSAGWLSTAADLLGGRIGRHSWTVIPWGVVPDLDFPDIAAAAYPAAFLALLCRRDHLFTLDGMEAAAEALEQRYRALGGSAPAAAEFYDVPHCMTAAMQERAAAWMEEFVANRVPSGPR